MSSSVQTKYSLPELYIDEYIRQRDQAFSSTQKANNHSTSAQLKQASYDSQRNKELKKEPQIEINPILLNQFTGISINNNNLQKLSYSYVPVYQNDDSLKRFPYQLASSPHQFTNSMSTSNQLNDGKTQQNNSINNAQSNTPLLGTNKFSKSVFIEGNNGNSSERLSTTPHRNTTINQSLLGQNIKIYTPNRKPKGCKIVFAGSPSKQQIEEELNIEQMKALSQSQSNQNSLRQLKDSIKFLTFSNTPLQEKRLSSDFKKAFNINGPPKY